MPEQKGSERPRASELLDVFKRQRAHREYRDDPVPDEVLWRLLDHARFASSGGNRQGWRIVVVTDPTRRARIVVVGEFNSGKTALVNALVGAPVLTPSSIVHTAHLTVVGSGPLEADLRQRFARPTIEFAGRLDDAELFARSRGSDCFVFASLYEGASDSGRLRGQTFADCRNQQPQAQACGLGWYLGPCAG